MRTVRGKSALFSKFMPHQLNSFLNARNAWFHSKINFKRGELEGVVKIFALFILNYAPFDAYVPHKRTFVPKITESKNAFSPHNSIYTKFRTPKMHHEIALQMTRVTLFIPNFAYFRFSLQWHVSKTIQNLNL